MSATTPVRFTTASGSRYVIDRDTLTRLSERPVIRGGQPDYAVLSNAAIDHVIQPPTLGEPFCAIVDGDRLKTTRVIEVER